jgi:ATP-dependent Lon protease
MTRDNKSKLSNNKNNKKSKGRKQIEESESSESDVFEDDEDDDDDDDDDEEEEFDMQKYRKMLASTFPSKHLNKKVAAGEKIKKVLKDEHTCKKDVNGKKGGKKQVKEESESEEEDESDDSSDSDYVDESEPKKSSKFNIVFTIGEKSDDEEGEWDTCSNSNDDDEDTENEDDPISSDEDDDEEDEDNNKKDAKKNVKKDLKNEIKKNEKKDLKDLKNEIKDENIRSIEKGRVEILVPTVLTLLKELQTKNKDDKLVSECIKICEEKLEISKKNKDRIEKKTKDRNDRIFKKILRDKNTMNDFDFFKKMEVDQQKKIIKELREINKITRIEKPYRLTLLESDIPILLKSAALKKIATLRNMEPGSGEFYKIKNWVDTFMRLPFGNYTSLPISIENGVEACHDFMANAQKTLNEAVYGLNDAKMQIMQMLGQLITNPKSIGTAIAIHGPPGTGKTSIFKDGISKILNRPFAFIALGGATDSSFLEGHGYTYEGSTWGKIVQILIDSKCMNPVIFFDELDKISDTPKGEEITGILTHLTDTTQNSQFHDKYFTEIDFDLSKCLFIFSYNDESKINPVLRDRMYRIQTKGYNQKQKTVIANDYLLPRVREQVKFTTDDIIIPNDVLHYIIENCCGKEDGVRNLKRCLEIIYTKLNLYRLMKPGSNLFEEDMSIKVEFPFTVTKVIVDKLIKNSKDSGTMQGLYI